MNDFNNIPAKNRKKINVIRSVYHFSSRYITVYLVYHLLSLTVPDGTPSSFLMTIFNSTTLKLSWQPIPDTQQNGIIVNYTIGCNTTEFESTQVSADDQLEMTNGVYNLVIYGLTPGTTYECYVFANSTEGAGPSAKLTRRTREESMFLAFCFSVPLLACMSIHLFIHLFLNFNSCVTQDLVILLAMSLLLLSLLTLSWLHGLLHLNLMATLHNIVYI